MKTAPQLEPLTAGDAVPSSTYNVTTTATVTDYAYASAPAPTAKPVMRVTTTDLPDFRTLRALGRQAFGAEAAREYLHEGILFACMLVVAAWPLGVTLNQLGTMMISPPPWVS
jgi:hypothetical protein